MQRVESSASNLRDAIERAVNSAAPIILGPDEFLPSTLMSDAARSSRRNLSAHRPTTFYRRYGNHCGVCGRRVQRLGVYRHRLAACFRG